MSKDLERVVHEADEDDIGPALFHHCVTVYDKMLNQAEKTYLEGIEGMVYEGFLTKLVTKECHLSVPYYTYVTAALQRMGCAQKLQKGGSSRKSQWLLITEPTLDVFNEKVGTMKARVKYVTEKQYLQQLQRTNDLNNRVNRIEKTLGLR